MCFTDKAKYFFSEALVYRLLKAWDSAVEADLDNLLAHIDGSTRDDWRDVGMVLAHWTVVNPGLGETLRKKFDAWSNRWPDRFNAADQENQWYDWVGRVPERKEKGEPLKNFGTLVLMAGGRAKCPEPVLPKPVTVAARAPEAGCNETEPPRAAVANEGKTAAAQQAGSSGGPHLMPVWIGPADDEAMFLWTATQPDPHYDRVRKDVAAKIGVNVGTLDDERKKRRPPTMIEDVKNLAGRGVSFPDIKPHPDPVDGAELLDATVEAILKYVVMPYASAVAAALWCLHAWAFEASDITPRLGFRSPEKRCGKTTLRDVLAELLPKALPSENITAAAVFRIIEKERPTLLIDEADAFLKGDERLRNVINSGHRRGGQVILTVGDDHETRVFSTFGPMLIAGIGGLAGTIEDRSIIIALRRRRRDEPVARFRTKRVGHLHELRRKIARWVADNFDALRDAEPDAPPELHDRAIDNWEPLFAIADAARGDWPERARDAALIMTAEGAKLETDGLSTMLLKDIRVIFETLNVDRLPSAKLVSCLINMRDRPWQTVTYGRELNEASLARRLKPYGIEPHTIRISPALAEKLKTSRTGLPSLIKDETDTPKGYYLSDFEGAFSSYIL